MSDPEMQKEVDKSDSSKAINATSWSLGMKIYHTAIPCFLAFLITFSASVTVPATSALMIEFAVSRTVAILSETMYMLGLAFGPMIMAPLSEFIGRRWLYIATSSSIIAFAGGAGAARNLATYLWVVALIGAPIWILILFMKETSDSRVRATAKHSGPFSTVRLALSMLKAAVFRSMAMLTTEAIAFSLTLYTGYAYSVVFSYFASATYVYTLDYGFDSRSIGLSFISVLIGYLLACVTYLVIEKTLYARAARQAPNGHPAPEHRLYSAMAGSIFLPIGLFWYAWAAHPGGHWAVVVASGIPFGLGAFVLFLSSMIYLVESYGPDAAASAIAANGSFRYLLGAVFPLFTIQMYEKLGVHWPGSVFAFLSLGLLPIPWILFKFGHQLRKNSRFIASSQVEE
ncbi:hypothetical protein TrVGV298_006265 [Trichoderma virens]|nr:hypothetical protein TrVGV298_006265 [Trichoderma virens]